MHTAVSRDEKLPPEQKAGQSSKASSEVWKERRARRRERHNIRERPLSFGGSSSEAGGRDTMREKNKNKEKERIVTAEYKFFLTDQIATESESPSR